MTLQFLQFVTLTNSQFVRICVVVHLGGFDGHSNRRLPHVGRRVPAESRVRRSVPGGARAAAVDDGPAGSCVFDMAGPFAACDRGGPPLGVVLR